MSGPIDHYEIRWRPADSDGEWESIRLSSSESTAQLGNVDRSKSYVIEARSVGPTNLKSIWVDISHTVAGNSPPQVPTGVSALGVADGVKLKWSYGNTPRADLITCVERGTTSGGPWTEVAQVKSDSFIVSEKVNGVFYYRLRSKNFRDDYSTYSSTVSGDPETLAEINTAIATALLTAQNAQATADGGITSFFQTAPPVIGAGAGQAQVGDIWFDTDDGNKLYRVVGSSWVVSADDDMAQALAAAAGAQATADGKVETYFQPTAPTAEAIGDLWFNTATGQLFRWNGFNWSDNIGDVTFSQIAGNGSNILWDEFSQFRAAKPLNTATNPPVLAVGANALLSAVSDGNSASGFSLQVTSSDTNTSGTGVAFATSGSDYNLPVEGGRRYIVSWFGRVSVAGHSILPVLTYPTGNTNGVNVAMTVSQARYSCVIDLTGVPVNTKAYLTFFCNRSGVAGRSVFLERIMVEPAVGTQGFPGAYTPGAAGRNALLAIVNAASAQSTADGKIDSFYQPNPPAVASEGDIWFDTDDSNKIYTRISGAWVATPDSRIAQAIADAAGAQATADGKVETFYQATTPTATAVGDLWFNTVTRIMARWSGATWEMSGSGVGVGTGLNLIANANLALNISGVPFLSDVWAADTLIADDWKIAQSNPASAANALRVYRHTLLGTMFRVAQGQSVAHNTQHTIFIRPITDCVVDPGRIYTARFKGNYAWASAVPAGLSILARMTVFWFDEGLVQIGAALSQDIAKTAGDVSISADYTAPAGAKFARPRLEYYIVNLSGSTFVAGPGAADFRIAEINFSIKPSMDSDVTDGTQYVRPYVDDMYYTGGYWRNALRYGASGRRIGSQANLNQVVAYSVRTTIALTATSLGKISINAHTVRYGSFSVSYNAVANAISGLTTNVTYVVYCIDDAFTGGTKTWFTAATPEAAQAIGDGVYVAGYIKIPSSGSGSGGGAGGGTDPNDWCVDAETTVLEDGRYVADLVPGDMVPCWNGDPENPQQELMPLLGMSFGDENCYSLITMSGYEIVQSASTPMDLRDGRSVTTPEMKGEFVLTEDLVWEEVILVLMIGTRKVAKPDFGNRMFFAKSNTSDKCVATHNGQMKP